MAHIINQKHEITKRPPLHLMMASLMGNHDDWGNLPFVTFTTRTSLERKFGDYQPKRSFTSRIVITTLSRDRFMREIVFDGSFLSQLGPGVDIAGSIVLDNSRPSYLWFVDDIGLKITDHDEVPVFPQLSAEEQRRFIQGDDEAPPAIQVVPGTVLQPPTT